MAQRLLGAVTYVVRYIITHANAHADELTAICNLLIFGSKVFPGISNAPVRTTGDPQSIDGKAELEQKHGLPVGVGRHIFDEHADPDSGKCCNDLVLEFLQVVDRAALRIAMWIRYADKRPDVRPFEIPTLVKYWHRIMPFHHVMGRYRKIYDALLRFGRGERAERPWRFNLERLAMRVRQVCPQFQNNPALKRVIYYLEDVDDILYKDGTVNTEEIISFHDRSGIRPLELANVIRVFSQVYEWQQRDVVELLVVNILKDVVTLGAKYQELLANYVPRFVRFEIPEGDREYRIAHEYTDDEDIAKVTRRFGADITIIRNSSGNKQILTNHNSRIDLRPVARVVRKTQLLKLGLPVPDQPDSYWEQADVPEVPGWHLHVGKTPEGYLTFGFYNGTKQSSTTVAASPLTVEELLDITTKFAALQARIDDEEADTDTEEEEEELDHQLEEEARQEEVSAASPTAH